MPPPWSISVGGIVVVCAFILTMGLWIQYWGRDHNYHETAEGMSNSELWARTFGQIANMVRCLRAREQTDACLFRVSQALLSSVQYRVLSQVFMNAGVVHALTIPFTHLLSQVMALLLFPVSKNSILTSAFGIAWEQVAFQLVYFDVFRVTLAVCQILGFKYIIKLSGRLDLHHHLLAPSHISMDICREPTPK